MFQATVNQKDTFNIDLNDPQFKDWDIAALNNNRFNIIRNHQSFNATIAKIDKNTKTITVQVNGTNYTVSLKDKMDLLLEKMGMSDLASEKVNEIVAPMPSLVLDIQTTVGASIQKGDAIMILEAMKMENVLKSPGEGVVKQIHVKQGVAVEKGQVLITLE